MPNHVTNKMVFENEECAALIMKLKMQGNTKNHQGFMDFNKISPSEQDDDWYQNNLHNWGTKWNAYSQSGLEKGEDGKLYCRFDTAWSTPAPIFEDIAMQHPEAEITVYYADEDTGCNLGIIYIRDGVADVSERGGESDEEKLKVLNAIFPEAYAICPYGEGLYDKEFPEDCGCEEDHGEEE